jgi:hypothetical protein
MAKFAFINTNSDTSLSDTEENLRVIRSHVTRRLYEEQRLKTTRYQQKKSKPALINHPVLAPKSEISIVSDADGKCELALAKSRRKVRRKVTKPEALAALPFGINPSQLDPFCVSPVSIRPDRLDRTLHACRFRPSPLRFPSSSQLIALF